MKEPRLAVAAARREGARLADLANERGRNGIGTEAPDGARRPDALEQRDVLAELRERDRHAALAGARTTTGHARRTAVPSPGRRSQLEPPAERERALFHADQPERLAAAPRVRQRSRVRRRRPRARARSVHRQRDPDRSRPGMPDGVGQRLLRDAIDADLGLLVEPRDRGREDRDHRVPAARMPSASECRLSSRPRSRSIIGRRSRASWRRCSPTSPT